MTRCLSAKIVVTTPRAVFTKTNSTDASTLDRPAMLPSRHLPGCPVDLSPL
jgi:hypothetical protein